MSYNTASPFASSPTYSHRYLTNSSRVPGSQSARNAYRPNSPAADPTCDRKNINSRRTPLHDAVIAASLSEVKRLIALGGSNINQEDRVGFAALHFAVISGNEEIVAYLLKHGAGKSMNRPAFAGFTPLALACNAKDQENPNIVRLLLAEGASPNVSLPGFGANRLKPIHLAAINGHAGIINELIKSGVDVNQTIEGSSTTALGMAIDYGQHKVVEFLQSLGGVASSRVPSPPADPRYSERSIRRSLSSAAQMTPFQEVQLLKNMRTMTSAHARVSTPKSDSDSEVASPK